MPITLGSPIVMSKFVTTQESFDVTEFNITSMNYDLVQKNVTIVLSSEHGVIVKTISGQKFDDLAVITGTDFNNLKSKIISSLVSNGELPAGTINS